MDFASFVHTKKWVTNFGPSSLGFPGVGFDLFGILILFVQTQEWRRPATRERFMKGALA